MSDDSDSNLLIGRIETGYIIVVVGRGTCRESAAVEQFATEALEAEGCAVTIDLSACTHLDSTFLGCLVHLHKRFGAPRPSRLIVVASPNQAQKLLAPSRLDTFLEISNKPPNIRDTLMALSQAKVDEFEMGRHVLECHRLLADLGGPHAAAFAAVADELERELVNNRPRAAKTTASG
jgi:anti-anti-sigma regulatory factor